MIERHDQVSRKTVEEDRIAICPHFGCKHLEKVKPLKFSFLGFQKYPKCSKHKISLIFVDEFIGSFIQAINACLFDVSALPPESVINLIKIKAPNSLKVFISGWMYCAPLGRGAQIVSNYMDGLSRSYMKLLSRKQRKSLQNEKSSKKPHEKLRSGLKKIAGEYTNFLQNLRKKSEIFHNPEVLRPFSDEVRNFIQIWLKEYLNEIQVSRDKKGSASLIQNRSLSILKEEYDKILHVGTCTLLLGKAPEILRQGISAFELFSAYHEFSEAGLCRELKREDIQVAIKDKETTMVLSISIPHFKQKLINNLKKLYDLIDGTTDQKEFIWSKSIEILDDFISRAENNEFYIPKNVNLKVIASMIIYTVALIDKNVPKISTRQIAKLANIIPSSVNRYYKTYFEQLYPRMELAIYGFKRIRLIISLYFFKLIKNKEIETSELILKLEENIFSEFFKEYFGDNFKKDINSLRNMVTQYRDVFIKFFSDLAEIIKLLANTSKVHKKIGARVYIKPLVDFLKENGINLLQKSRFVFSIREIYDFLREKYFDLFPPRAYRAKEESLTDKQRMKKEKDLRRIIGSKLKLFAIKNIYNGKYFKNGKSKCPQCQKEGLIINTDISRLTALEFHHTSGEKDNNFTASKLYELFTKNLSNPHFLELIIKLMESEHVVLICRNHHRIIEDKYYGYFKYIINWKDIFSYPPELIHALIRISVDNFRETKRLTPNTKAGIRDAIARYIKKRYIIEYFYGEFCHTCREFRISKHLPAFTYHHKNEETKTVNISKVYHLPCSEIIRIIEKEEGGYICSNCHRILHHNKFIPLLNEIYDHKNNVRQVFNDYNRVTREFAPIDCVDSAIRNPLIKPTLDTDGFMKFLIAIYEISKSGRDATNISLKEYLEYKDKSSIISFFSRRYDVMRQYVGIIRGTRSKANPTKYYLNDNGKNAVSLIYKFRDYYRAI